jgi:hypothetical protein
MSDEALFQTTILFHGNCIDGWFAAYFAYCELVQHGGVQMFPIAPSQPNTWPAAEVMEGTDVWLLDVSVPAYVREEWTEARVRSIQCIDHHATAIEQWPAEACPIHTDHCAALQAYHHFFHGMEAPEWLHSIDRVDRWVDVTYEDRCLREFLHELARLPVQHRLADAIRLTNSFFFNMNNHPETFQWYVEKGEKFLHKKDAHLWSIIDSKGHTVTIDEEHVATWNVPSTWVGHKLFLMNTTDVILDTTEASHLVFTKHSDISVFINYRNKVFYTKPQKGTMKSMIVYSARSSVVSGINLTEGTIFSGHPTSAGASLVRGEATHFPFLLESL